MTFTNESSIRLPSLKWLQGFEAAARHGNFSRAADELHLTQSAISHQVLWLEEQLGQPLFRRVGRGVELTVAGDVLLRSVQRSLAVLRGGLGRIATYMDPGLVTLVAPLPLLQGWLLPRLAGLQAAVPGICPVLSGDVTARYVDEVDVDLLLTDRELNQSGLSHSLWRSEEWVTVAAPALAQRLNVLPLDRHRARAPLICLEAAITDEATAGVFAQHLQHLNIGLVLDDPRLVLAAVVRGLGLACMSSVLADEALRAGQLQVLPAYTALPGKTWWLARVAGPARSPFVEAMHAWLQAQGQGERSATAGQPRSRRAPAVAKLAAKAARPKRTRI